MIIGVLALQGCVDPHQKHIEALGATFKKVRYAKDLNEIDALILTGWESSTMLNLLDKYHLWKPLKDRSAEIPVWGVCAGTILMAKYLDPKQPSLGLMDLQVKRNAYGRQLDSKQEKINDYPVSFIRAPIIMAQDEHLTVHHKDCDRATWVSNDQYMATTFHSELSEPTPSPMHQFFFELVGKFQKSALN